MAALHWQSRTRAAHSDSQQNLHIQLEFKEVIVPETAFSEQKNVVSIHSYCIYHPDVSLDDLIYHILSESC